jgi:hypothetical protein
MMRAGLKGTVQMPQAQQKGKPQGVQPVEEACTAPITRRVAGVSGRSIQLLDCLVTDLSQKCYLRIAFLAARWIGGCGFHERWPLSALLVGRSWVFRGDTAPLQ